MCRADGAGLDPPGVPLALLPMAPAISRLEDASQHKTPDQALPLQTGNAHGKKNEQMDMLQDFNYRSTSNKYSTNVDPRDQRYGWQIFFI